MSRVFTLCRKLLKKWILLVLAICTLISWTYIFTDICSNSRSSSDRKVTKRDLINPPKLSEEDERKILLQVLNGSMNRLKKLEILSTIVQNQIKSLQSASLCSGPTIQCGHYQKCGFGCQVHHRVACLMLSYAMNIPLIHDELEGWPHSKNWSYVFKPIGSNCTQGPSTIYWSWKDPTSFSAAFEQCYTSSKKISGDDFQYPLRNGIPVDKKLANLVENVSPNPFLWWVGQFMKYSMRLNTRFEGIIDNSLEQIVGQQRPIVGIHVRRTDKGVDHDVVEYMDKVEQYFLKFPLTNDKEDDIPRRVFVASDDSTVLTQIKNKYPNYKVGGFQTEVTLRNAESRVNALFEIVQDVMILSECDYVICGYSSNVCRLILEIFSFKQLDPEDHILSLDGDYAYEYVLQAHTFPSKIAQIDTTMYKAYELNNPS